MAPKAKLVAYHPVHGYKIKPQQDLKTIKRNERERSRVQTVNNGFETLRKHIPTAAALKKMSKVNILTEAMDYIQYLRSVLQNTSEVKSEPVLINFSQTKYQGQMYQHYPHHHQIYPPQVFHTPPTPTTPTMTHFPYPTNDQGFYSDYSQPSPALPTPHDVHHSPSWHSPRYPPHLQQDPLSPASKVSSSTDKIPTDVTHPVSSSYKYEKYEDISESSGDEDDILDAIAEWQQV